MSLNDAYNQMVDSWITSAIKAGVHDFDELVGTLPGVYPGIVRDRLMRLAEAKTIPSNKLKRFLESRRKSSPILSEIDALPLPHPLDFEWRFSWEASERIIKTANRLAAEKEDILLLSAPSVYYYCIRTEAPRNIKYFGDHTAVTDFLCGTIDGRGASCDFFSEKISCVNSGVVVIDPPWYEDYMYHFTLFAAAACNIGGHVILSFPPLGTRPGISEEWNFFLDWAEHLGLILVNHEREALPYDSPFFEMNALKADGIIVSREWRKGDFCIFRKTQEVPEPKQLQSEAPEWKEVTIDRVRFKIFPTDKSQLFDPRLVSLIPGDILPSVSRRDPRRSLATVWTSGNRIFRCDSPDVLGIILFALREGGLPCTYAEDYLGIKISAEETGRIAEATAQVEEILSNERNDFETLMSRPNESS